MNKLTFLGDKYFCTYTYWSVVLDTHYLNNVLGTLEIFSNTNQSMELFARVYRTGKEGTFALFAGAALRGPNGKIDFPGE